MTKRTTQQTFLRAWSSEGQGIWRFDADGQPQLVVLQGQTANAADGNRLTLGSIDNLFINELGDVAFEGEIVGASDENRDEAIWSVAASDRKLRLLIQEGDMSAEGTNGAFPLTRLKILGVDNAGRVLVSGGDAANDGLFAVTIPEPASLQVTIAGTIVMLLTRRRRDGPRTDRTGQAKKGIIGRDRESASSPSRPNSGAHLGRRNEGVRSSSRPVKIS